MALSSSQAITDSGLSHKKLMPQRMLMALGVAIALTLGGCAVSGSSPSAQAPAPEAGTETVAASSSEAGAVATEATEPAIRYFAENNIAIRGADPVAYFTDNAYVPGSGEFSHDWQGVTWQFANAANRDAFAANPEAYAPQYGGFCAWAVSQGYTADIDPEAWKIVDGKLYLNYSPGIQKKWARDIPGNIAKADQNWPGVLTKG